MKNGYLEDRASDALIMVGYFWKNKFRIPKFHRNFYNAELCFLRVILTLRGVTRSLCLFTPSLPRKGDGGLRQSAPLRKLRAFRPEIIQGNSDSHATDHGRWVQSRFRFTKRYLSNGSHTQRSSIQTTWRGCWANVITGFFFSTQHLKPRNKNLKNVTRESVVIFKFNFVLKVNS